MNIVQKKAEHLAVRNVILKAVFFAFACKDNANRKQNKMNLFIFYAETQFIFAFSAKIGEICLLPSILTETKEEELSVDKPVQEIKEIKPGE